ncbi:MAG: hypothetical protein NUK65_04495 [Firmicutes bacterium]|nr:hypothetical protein [Bacillota bacterium]
MLLFLLVLALVSIVILEAPRLAFAKLWRELAVFFTLWSFASFLAIAQVIGLELPNPIELITQLIQ